MCGVNWERVDIPGPTPYHARCLQRGLMKGEHVAGRCQVCGKGVAAGGMTAHRGIAKSKGGIGKKITGRTKRKFRPNIQRIKVKVGGSAKRMNVCTKCITSGRIEKP